MSECIVTKLYKDKDGYGRKSLNGKVQKEHRVAYCKANNIEISSIVGKVVMHSCDNPSCVNPLHLSIGSNKENTEDMVLKGRARNGYSSGRPDFIHARQCGESNGRAKITDEIAKIIRDEYIPRSSLSGTRALGRRFGIDQKSVSLIVAGKTWKRDSSLDTL